MRHKTTKIILFKLFAIILLYNCVCVCDAFPEWSKPCSSRNTEDCENTTGAYPYGNSDIYTTFHY